MNDPTTTVLLFLLIPAFVFAACALYINRRVKRPPAVEEADTAPLPALPLLDVTLEIVMTDPASGKRYMVHFGVESVEMLEDE